MASSVYSTRFLWVNAVGGTASYTVPEGYAAIVRDVDAFQAGGAANVLWDLVNETHGYVIAAGFFEGTEGFSTWRGRQVVPAGEVIESSAGGSGIVSIAVSGYLLTLP